MDEQKLYDKIYTWLITFGPRMLLAIVILIAGIWLIRLIRRWSGRLHQPQKP